MLDNVRGMLALLTVPGVVPMDCFRTSTPPDELYELLQSPRGREQIGSEVGKSLGCPDWGFYESQLEALDRTGASVISAWSVEYPAALRYVNEPPPLLFYRGDVSLLPGRGVAVVGTRKPTPAGLALARRLARDLAAAEVTVISGMARGIDTAAHEGALRNRRATVAVLGTGIDVPYPPENDGLMVDIARSGCVVTEQLMGMHASRHVFPRRNRLISGLSNAVVVVEGGARSGALITARWALEQGRDVGAVPGFPGDFRSEAPNLLLREGAFMVESVRDVFANVPSLGRNSSSPGRNFSVPARVVGDEAAADLFAAVGKKPVDATELCDMLGIDVAVVQQTLARLEIEGLLERDASGKYYRSDI